MPIKGQSPKQIVHTEMHKFKHGTLRSGSKHGPLVKSRKQAIAIALSESGQSRKRQSGGSIPIRMPNTLNAMMQGVEQDPLNPHAQLGMLAPYAIPGAPMPSARIKRPTHIDEKSDSDKEKGYQAGGEITDIGEPLIPSGGQFSPGIPAVNKAVDIGSKIAGNAVIGAATLPYRYPKAMIDAAMTQPGSEEAHQAYGDVGNVTGEMGLNMIGPKGGVPEGSTFGVFVGPYGAKALRESGYNKPHPVYARQFAKDPAAMPPDLRDEVAKSLLAEGKVNPVHIFRESGWSRGAEGAPKLEIPDTGAKLVKNPDGEGYLLKHPAGDFHEIYNLPPIQFNPSLGKGTKASFRHSTNQITLGIDPTKNNKEATSAVLHELQHAAQARENFAYGSNDVVAARSPEFEQEFFPGQPIPSWQLALTKERLKDNPERLRHVLSVLDSPRNREILARGLAYERSAGETEARNVQRRFENRKKYTEYPEFTEDIGRGLQQVRTFRAVGGPIGNQRAPQSDRNAPPSDDMDLDPNISGLRSEDRNRIHPDSVQEPPTMRRFQMGGFNPEKAMSIGLSRKASQASGGLLKSQIPGRTDQIQASIPKGAYIIPADVVSGMGQGNTDAGGAILGKLMNRGPFGMNLPKRTAGSRVGSRHSSLKFSQKFDDGGGVGEPEPVLAAGGEYVVMPHEVAALGAGDVDTGHNILDAFVKHMREKTIQTMRKLPGPKGAKR